MPNCIPKRSCFKKRSLIKTTSLSIIIIIYLMFQSFYIEQKERSTYNNLMPIKGQSVCALCPIISSIFLAYVVRAWFFLLGSSFLATMSHHKRSQLGVGCWCYPVLSEGCRTPVICRRSREGQWPPHHRTGSHH